MRLTQRLLCYPPAMLVATPTLPWQGCSGDTEHRLVADRPAALVKHKCCNRPGQRVAGMRNFWCTSATRTRAAAFSSASPHLLMHLTQGHGLYSGPGRADCGCTSVTTEDSPENPITLLDEKQKSGKVSEKREEIHNLFHPQLGSLCCCTVRTHCAPLPFLFFYLYVFFFEQRSLIF